MGDEQSNKGEQQGQPAPAYPPPEQYPPAQYPPPQQYPPAQYPPPYYPPPSPYRPHQPQPPNNGFAVASMICGIVGLVFVLPVAGPILAIIFGTMGKKQIAASEGREGGESMASAGVIMGAIGLPLNIIGIALFFVFLNAVTDTAEQFIDIFPTITPT